MSRLIPLYIAGPCAPGGRAEHRQSVLVFLPHTLGLRVHIAMSGLKIKACNRRQSTAVNPNSDDCVLK